MFMKSRSVATTRYAVAAIAVDRREAMGLQPSGVPVPCVMVPALPRW